MIDWLTYSFKIQGDWFIRGDTITVIDSDTGEIKSELYKFKMIDSQTSASIKTGVRQIDYNTEEDYSTIQISGNPAKYFQGHNLWGSNNARAICYEYAKSVMERIFHISLLPTINLWAFKITKIDCTRNYMLENREQVRSWLRAAGAHISGGHQNVSKYDDETVYVGQRSRRIATKLYCKGAEYDKRLEAGQRNTWPDSNQIDKSVGRADIHSDAHDLMKAYADGILRIEVRVLSQELKKRNWQDADTWTPNRVELLIDERIKKLGIEELEMNATIPMDDKQQKLFILWQSGYDFRRCKKSTFYRYRAQMREVGINLLAPPEVKMVPVINYISADKVATPPQWGAIYNYYIPDTTALSGIHGPASYWRRGQKVDFAIKIIALRYIIAKLEKAITKKIVRRSYNSPKLHRKALKIRRELEKVNSQIWD